MRAVPYHSNDIIAPDKGVKLLTQFVQYQVLEPRVLSLVFSCISSLFPFIVHRPDVLQTVFVKIMTPLVAYSISDQPEQHKTKPMKELRRHCTCLLLKLVKQYPDVMLPGFDMVRNISFCAFSCHISAFKLYY